MRCVFIAVRLQVKTLGPGSGNRLRSVSEMPNGKLTAGPWVTSKLPQRKALELISRKKKKKKGQTNHVHPSALIRCSGGKTKGSAAQIELQSSRCVKKKKRIKERKKKKRNSLRMYLSRFPSGVSGERLTSHRGRPPHSSHAGRALILCRCLRYGPGRRQRGSASPRGTPNEPEQSRRGHTGEISRLSDSKAECVRSDSRPQLYRWLYDIYIPFKYWTPTPGGGSVRFWTAAAAPAEFPCMSPLAFGLLVS